jgi:DNA-binding transcriptional regulator WhiA
MKKKMEALADSWQTLAAEALSSMADWRVQHPRATLREIETAVDERLSALRARMRPARCPGQSGGPVRS